MNTLGKTTTFAALAIAGLLTFTGCMSSATVTPPAAGSEVSAEPAEETQAPAAAVGTRANPHPLGSMIESADWQVTVNSVNLDANDAIASENPFNDAPEEGTRYILVNATITYIGDDEQGGMPAFVSFDYVTADGTTTDSLSQIAVAPDSLDSMSTLYNGGSITGNKLLIAPAEGAEQGVLAVRPGMVTDKIFVAVQ